MDMARTYEGSHQAYDVICESNVMVPMRDGVTLATDIYLPSTGGREADGRFPVILERTPYDKASPSNVTKGKFFARRGYVCAIQDVRGRFKSEGEWYAFAEEAPDGYETVQWLGAQSWSDGKVGTMGDSYCGSNQAALATLSPSHLSTMIVGVGASNYYHSSMRQNGALEQRFHIYVFRMAATSKEAEADPALKAALVKAFVDQMPEVVNQFPLKEGATILRRLPSYERWAIDIMTHGEYDDYWKQRGYAISEYYEEHADVPTLYLGGWYDTYPRNTCASYMALSKMKKSPQVLMMGPWTHAAYETSYAGDLDFGTEAQIDYNDLKLAWFDHHMKDMHTEVSDWSPVHIFTMGTGDGTRTVLGSPGVGPEYPGRINHGGYWRREPDWPLPGTSFTPYYLHGDGSLSPEKPGSAGSDNLPPSTYTFDPKNPVPTIGGSLSASESIMRQGAFDQRGRPDFFGCTDTLPLNSRNDVLTFQTPPLEEDLEVTGPIEMRLWASSSAVDTDFTAKLIDCYPPSADYPEGLAINVTDSIIRARYRNGWEAAELMTPGQPYEFVFQLYPTSNVFKKGHRVRLDISSSNWPRFDVNPNTGGPLGRKQKYEVAHQAAYHDANHPSHVVLPVQGK
jgi:putative CocE/NonD family hydrolase